MKTKPFYLYKEEITINFNFIVSYLEHRKGRYNGTGNDTPERQILSGTNM